MRRRHDSIHFVLAGGLFLELLALAFLAWAALTLLMGLLHGAWTLGAPGAADLFRIH